MVLKDFQGLNVCLSAKINTFSNPSQSLQITVVIPVAFSELPLRFFVELFQPAYNFQVSSWAFSHLVTL